MICCLAVNDPFVMAAWADKLKTKGKVSTSFTCELKCLYKSQVHTGILKQNRAEQKYV